MEKNKTKQNNRNKTAIRLIGKEKDTKRTLLHCQLLQRRGSSIGHCKLKLIQINQVESNQMQVLEESGKPQYPGKKISEKSREPTKLKSNQ